MDVRLARPADVPALETLIASSARALGRGFYTDEQSEAAIAHVFGVDSTLIADRTFFIAEIAGALAGCGGWSRRETLFGGDRYGERRPALLDPARDRARVRAFFVEPAYARRGVGTALLRRCEDSAAAAGFAVAALMATLPGVPFYAAHGFRAGETVRLDLSGVETPFVPMRKAVLPDSNINNKLSDSLRMA